jgi:hypothetical protein
MVTTTVVVTAVAVVVMTAVAAVGRTPARVLEFGAGPVGSRPGSPRSLKTPGLAGPKHGSGVVGRSSKRTCRADGVSGRAGERLSILDAALCVWGGGWGESGPSRGGPSRSR